MEFIFWFATLLILYIYIGYPLLIKLWPKRYNVQSSQHSAQPSVTVIIAAYNEEKYIAQTISNKLAQNYPQEKLSIVVVSDESTDQTDALVQQLMTTHSNLHLIRQEPRQGKTAALNRAVAETSSDIIVFSDANSIYHPDAIAHLVNTLEDDSIGYVTGKMVYVNQQGEIAGDGTSAYMRYENFLRSLETKTSSVVGVDGGIDAMRRELYSPMNADQLPDFVQPLKVIAQGKRVAYCEQALLNEESVSNSDAEFKMRVRVSLRAFWAMSDMRELFNPRKFGFFSVQLFSHKLLRYLAFIPLIIAFVSNGFITGEDAFYYFTFAIQVGFYAAAAYVSLSPGQYNKWLTLAHYFCVINIAALMAFIKFSKGEKIVIWKPRAGE